MLSVFVYKGMIYESADYLTEDRLQQKQLIFIHKLKLLQKAEFYAIIYFVEVYPKPNIRENHKIRQGISLG